MMKHCLVLAFLFLTLRGNAETPEQFFEQANQAYQQGNFAEAIAKYEHILHSGMVEPALYYNLGNASYKSGRISKAILNYERALKLIPNDDDLLHNLHIANMAIANRIVPAPRLFVWDWWDSMKASFSLNGITWLGYFFFLVTVGSIVLVVLARSYSFRRLGLLAGVASLFFLAFTSVIFLAKLNAVQSSNTAIVTANITTVKNSPDAKSTDAFVLHDGVKVFIIDTVNEWFKIRLADGKVGWMERTAAEII